MNIPAFTAHFERLTAARGVSKEIAYTHAVCDLLLWASLTAIAVIMAGFLRRRHDQAMAMLFWFLGAFLLLLGGLHLITSLWWFTPVTGGWIWVKITAAVLSAVTILLLGPMTPGAMRIPSVKQLAERSKRLVELNFTLQKEVANLQQQVLAIANRDVAAAEKKLSDSIGLLKKTTES